MHDTPRSVGTLHAPNLVGFQTAVGTLGYTLLPIAMGTVLRLTTTEWLGSMLVGLTLVLVGIVFLRDRAISERQGFTVVLITFAPPSRVRMNHDGPSRERLASPQVRSLHFGREYPETGQLTIGPKE